MMTLEHVSYVVWTLENHFDQWKHALWIETLKDDEKIKAKTYKRLENGEWEKYAPKKPRYTSGAGTKREYGRSLVSDKGKKRFAVIKKNWKVAWEDESIRAALTEEWRKCAAKNKMYQGLERTEDAEGKGASGGGGGEEEEEVPEIDLHGDHCNGVSLVVPV